jgi:hypothetical protein
MWSKFHGLSGWAFGLRMIEFENVYKFEKCFDFEKVQLKNVNNLEY